MITKRRLTLCAVLSLGLGLGSTSASDAYAAPPAKAAKTKAPAAPVEAPTTVNPISVKPKELAWGIDRIKLGKIYDKIIEDDFKARYMKVQPGTEMEALDAEVAEKKSEFRRSLTEFDTIATGYDNTPLASEYTYRNKETLMTIDRGGKVRYFFFIKGRLWKIIDVLSVGEKSSWGKTYDEAVLKLVKHYGVAGRVQEADPAKNRPNREVDWKDSVSQVRAIDWGGDKVALAFQDGATVADLDTLRSNKAAKANEIDAKVKASAAQQPGVPTPPKVDPKAPGAKQ